MTIRCSACPIAGAASYDWALTHDLSKATQIDFIDLSPSVGGYECLDLANSLDSCGGAFRLTPLVSCSMLISVVGCASTGEGQDCTKISHSKGVGVRPDPPSQPFVLI